jgi:hypothetical protein
MIKYKLISISILFFILFSCQQVEFLDRLEWNYDNFAKISISSKKINIIDQYEANFLDPYIDHSLVKTPKYFLNQWLNNNINFFGSENKLNINIIDASLKKNEIPNISLKKFQEKTIFSFELIFMIEFILYDDANSILANTIVESIRTTTSGKNISLKETEIIIDQLIFNSLIDFSRKVNEELKIYMNNYIL